MLKKIAPVAMAVVTLVSLGACSKAADPVNTATGGGATAAPAQSSSTSSPDTTEKKSTGTTKPKTTGTTGATHSTGTTKSSGNFDLTDDESSCITNAVASNPDIADAFTGDSQLTPEQAGIVGGLIAGCVPKPKIADGLVNDLKNSSDGRDLTQSQLSCIRDQIISLDTNDLAVFIGLIGYSQESGDRSVAATTISDLNSACGTRIPA